MRLLNHTRAVAASTLAHDGAGQAHLLVVAKATFIIPSPGRPVRLAERQVEVFASDVFSGKPGDTAPDFDHDFVLRKRYCEVLLCGHAYAPRGEPAPSVPVGLRVGTLLKTFRVTGYREWRYAHGDLVAGAARPFRRQRIGYDLAFGGVDNAAGEETVFWENPVGRGFHPTCRPADLKGKTMPQTESLDVPITSPSGRYMPMAFGPLPRHAQPRLRYAGTFDARWIEERMPVLPTDFDERYYQSAPPDQQLATLSGGEQVVLVNLTEEGETYFSLPPLDLTMEIKVDGQKPIRAPALADTLCLEPDLQRFTVTWRQAVRLRQSLREVETVVLGSPIADQRRNGVAVIPVSMLKSRPFSS